MVKSIFLILIKIYLKELSKADLLSLPHVLHYVDFVEHAFKKAAQTFSIQARGRERSSAR